MKFRNFAMMAVVAVVLVGLAVSKSRKPAGGGRTEAVGKLILADLPLNGVARVVFAGGLSTATVERIDGVWRCKEQHGYPADFGKLKKLLLAISELKVGQVVRLDESDRDVLKMRTPGLALSAETAGTEVSMLAGDGRLVASLLFGDSRKRKSEDSRYGVGAYPDGRYVSVDGGTTVYLIANDLYEVSVQPKDWVDAEILNVAGTSVRQVTVAHSGGDVLKFAKPEGGGNLALEGLAADEENDMSKIYNIESALSYLRFEGIASPDLTSEQLGMSSGVLFTVQTADGEEYRATVGGGDASGGDNRYVRFEAAFNPPPELSKPENVVDEQGEVGGEAKADVEKDAKRKAVELKIAELNAKLKSWTYVLSANKVGAMVVTRGEVVKKKELPKSVEGEVGQEDGSVIDSADSEAGDATEAVVPAVSEPAAGVKESAVEASASDKKDSVGTEVDVGSPAAEGDSVAE